MIATPALLAQLRLRWEESPGGPGYCELVRGGEVGEILGVMSVLALSVPRVMADGAAPSMRWMPVMYGDQPALALSDASDTVLAYLSPLDTCWEALVGAELPPLEDGPVRLTFPAMPTTLTSPAE